MVAHELDVNDCPDSRSPSQRMSVIEPARQVQGVAGRRVRRARPSEPAQGRTLPCRYVRSPEVTSGSAASFDHRKYWLTPAPECTDSAPAADVDPGSLTTWILRCRGPPASRTRADEKAVAAAGSESPGTVSSGGGAAEDVLWPGVIRRRAVEDVLWPGRSILARIAPTRWPTIVRPSCPVAEHRGALSWKACRAETRNGSSAPSSPRPSR